MTESEYERPFEVTIALRLLYIALTFDAFRLLSNGGWLFIDVGLFLFLFSMIGKGKDWARITCLILFIFIFESSVQAISKVLSVNTFFGLLILAQFILQFIAQILLFRQPAAKWFKQIRLETNLPQDPTNRPYEVNISLVLLSLPLVYEIIGYSATMILPVIADVVIDLFLFIMIWRRKKWARSALFGMSAYLIGKHIAAIPHLLKTDLGLGLQVITLYAIQLTAMLLLSSKPVDKWFKEKQIEQP